jgi:hypothetical protein
MIRSSLAYLRKKWLARKSEKKIWWNNCPSWIDKRKLHKNDVTLNTEERNRKRFKKELGTKIGRPGKDIMPWSDKLRSWSTCICSISFGLGPFFYHSFTIGLINSGMNRTVPHKPNKLSWNFWVYEEQEWSYLITDSSYVVS